MQQIDTIATTREDPVLSSRSGSEGPCQQLFYFEDEDRFTESEAFFNHSKKGSSHEKLRRLQKFPDSGLGYRHLCTRSGSKKWALGSILRTQRSRGLKLHSYGQRMVAMYISHRYTAPPKPLGRASAFLGSKILGRAFERSAVGITVDH